MEVWKWKSGSGNLEAEVWKWKTGSGAGSGAGTGSAAGSGKLDNKWKQEMPMTQNTVISSATNPLIECQGLLNGNTAALTPRDPT